MAIEAVAPYAVADAEIPLRLIDLQVKELKRVGGEILPEEIDLPLTPVLAGMEMEGVLLDLPFLKQMSDELTKRLAEIEKQIFKRCSPSSLLGPRRFHPPPISAEEIPLPDAVVISHDHYDHLDMESIRTLADTAFFAAAQ